MTDEDTHCCDNCGKAIERERWTIEYNMTREINGEEEIDDNTAEVVFVFCSEGCLNTFIKHMPEVSAAQDKDTNECAYCGELIEIDEFNHNITKSHERYHPEINEIEVLYGEGIGYFCDILCLSMWLSTWVIRVEDARIWERT